MEQFSTAALLVLFIVVFSNLRAGTLGKWFRAKFLNQQQGLSELGPAVFSPAHPTTNTGAHVPPPHIYPTGGGGRV